MASVLKCVKMNSFVLKFMHVMSMLSPLASKSCGGSHIIWSVSQSPDSRPESATKSINQP